MSPPDDETVTRLQEHVKATIAPYKYPRSVVFIDELPKTATGKVQRFRLRETPSRYAVNAVRISWRSNTAGSMVPSAWSCTAALMTAALAALAKKLPSETRRTPAAAS